MNGCGFGRKCVYGATNKNPGVARSFLDTEMFHDGGRRSGAYNGLCEQASILCGTEVFTDLKGPAKSLLFHVAKSLPRSSLQLDNAELPQTNAARNKALKRSILK